MNSATFLLDEPPVTFSRILAVVLRSADAAILFQALHNKLNTVDIDADELVNTDGRRYVRVGPSFFQNFMPWLEAGPAKRLLAELQDRRLVVSTDVQRGKKTVPYYTIDYVAWERLVNHE